MPTRPEQKPLRRRPLRRDEGVPYLFGPGGRFACTIIDLRYVGEHDHPIHTVNFFDNDRQILQLDMDADGKDVHFHTASVMVNHQTIVTNEGESPLEAGVRVALSPRVFRFITDLMNRNDLYVAAAPHLPRFQTETRRLCSPYTGSVGVKKAAVELASAA